VESLPWSASAVSSLSLSLRSPLWEPAWRSLVRPLILAAAIAGLVTAFPFWIPAGVLLAVAALVLGEPIELPTAATGMGTSSTRQMYTHRYADKG
jgi:hypothetical protein